jgi:hypothetical protein
MDMKILFAILFVSASCSSPPVQEVKPYPVSQIPEHLKPVPGDTPEPLFASTIIQRAKQANLGALKSKKVAG